MSDHEAPQSSEPTGDPPVSNAPTKPIEPPYFGPADDLQPSSARPRSLKRRLEQHDQSAAPSRVRSQPINRDAPSAARKRVREPVLLTWGPEPATGPWRAKPWIIGCAVAAWLLAIGLLGVDPARLEEAGLIPRVVVPSAWALAAAITFVPIQLRLAIPGVSWQGILGFGLLGYLLAFVPAPTGWLLDLPDLPVYLLLFFALFYAIAAAVVPLTYLVGQRFYKLRIHRLDVGRARRQAYEVGLLIVATLVMAGLRVLSPITFGLLALVIVLTEALLLSQVQPEG